VPSPDYLPGAKYGIRAFAGDTNIADLDAASQALVADIEAKLAGYIAGTNAARLAATALEGQIWRETDTGLWYVGTGSAWLQIPITAVSGGLAGSSIIPASESRTNTAYGTLPTPDQVAGLVLPVDGLIEVSYQASWQGSVAFAGGAALFLGANEVLVAEAGGAPASSGTTALIGGTANSNAPLFTTPTQPGLSSVGPGSTADVTTGQFIGGGGGGGGPVRLFAAAGTYTVSVRFKSTSGSVTVSNRRLYARVITHS
jgi:hypothetical protein